MESEGRNEALPDLEQKVKRLELELQQQEDERVQVIEQLRDMHEQEMQ